MKVRDMHPETLLALAAEELAEAKTFGRWADELDIGAGEVWEAEAHAIWASCDARRRLHERRARRLRRRASLAQRAQEGGAS